MSGGGTTKERACQHVKVPPQRRADVDRRERSGLHSGCCVRVPEAGLSQGLWVRRLAGAALVSAGASPRPPLCLESQVWNFSNSSFPEINFGLLPGLEICYLATQGAKKESNHFIYFIHNFQLICCFHLLRLLGYLVLLSPEEISEEFHLYTTLQAV